MEANRLSTKDLMVGDWVDFYHPYEPEKKIVTRHCVTEIFECGLVGISNHPNPVHADHIEPVKITPEILEKNGWTWNKYHTMLNLVVGTIHIGWGFYKDCLSISDHSDDGDCQISSLKCIYVHQLQHALRLCGIEKEITL